MQYNAAGGVAHVRSPLHPSPPHPPLWSPLHQAAWHMFGLPFIIFRPHNVYGPRQNIADKFRRALYIILY